MTRILTKYWLDLHARVSFQVAGKPAHAQASHKDGHSADTAQSQTNQGDKAPAKQKKWVALIKLLHVRVIRCTNQIYQNISLCIKMRTALNVCLCTGITLCSSAEVWEGLSIACRNSPNMLFSKSLVQTWKLWVCSCAGIVDDVVGIE